MNFVGPIWGQKILYMRLKIEDGLISPYNLNLILFKPCPTKPLLFSENWSWFVQTHRQKLII